MGYRFNNVVRKVMGDELKFYSGALQNLDKTSPAYYSELVNDGIAERFRNPAFALTVALRKSDASAALNKTLDSCERRISEIYDIATADGSEFRDYQDTSGELGRLFQVLGAFRLVKAKAIEALKAGSFSANPIAIPA